MDDIELMEIPENGPFSRCILFTCTFVATLDNLNIELERMTNIMCDNPHGCLVAINSNYGYAAQKNYEYLMKYPKDRSPIDEYDIVPNKKAGGKKASAAAAKTTSIARKPRKTQGYGTCFNSAIEPVIRIYHPGIPADKIYKIKCFPTTGEIQIPGVIMQDLSDSEPVLNAFINYLNEVIEPEILITIRTKQPKMLNYKFKVIRKDERVLIDLYALVHFLQRPSGNIAPPFIIREIKPPVEHSKVSFIFKNEDHSYRVNIFQSGKINFLGINRIEISEIIYKYMERIFIANWHTFIRLKPQAD